MKATRTSLFCLIVMLPFFTASCINLEQPHRKISYYTLEYNALSVTGSPALPLILSFSRFAVSPVYNSNKIYYGGKNLKRDSYHYHKWTAEPGELISYFLARDLKQAGLFKGVFSTDRTVRPTHTIEGIVDEFFECDVGHLWEAVLSITITLIKENEPDISNKILFQKNYKSRKTCKSKTPLSVAEAMSEAMAEISGRILSDVYKSLSRE